MAGIHLEVEGMMAFATAIKNALDAISYCQGGKVTGISQALNRKIPSSLKELMDGISLFRGQGNDAEAQEVLAIVGPLIAEASVVLPFDREIADAQQRFASMNAGAQLQEHQQAWKTLCFDVCKVSPTGDSVQKVFDKTDMLKNKNIKVEGAAKETGQEALLAIVDATLKAIPEPGPYPNIGPQVRKLADFVQYPQRGKDALLQSLEVAAQAVTTHQALLALQEKLLDAEGVDLNDQDLVLTLLENVAELQLRRNRLDKPALPVDLAGTSVLFQKADSLVEESKKQEAKAIDAMQLVACQQLAQVEKELTEKENGVGPGEEALTLPTKKKVTWKILKEEVSKTLGKSEVCAGLDEVIARSNQVSVSQTVS